MKIKYLILLSLAIGINITPVNAKSYDIDPNAKLTIGTLASYHNSGYDMKDDAGITPLFLYNNHRIYAEGRKRAYISIKTIHIGRKLLLAMMLATLTQKKAIIHHCTD